jgi:hypothetical protein
MIRLSESYAHFAAWIRRENRSRPTIVRALELRASYLLGVASQTVDISGTSAAMQACGVPCRGQDLPNATPSRLWSSANSPGAEIASGRFGKVLA